MSRFTQVVLAVTASILALAAQPANAAHAWGSYHWARSAHPLPLELGNNVSSTWTGYLNTTSVDWNAPLEIDTRVTAGMARGKCRPTEGRVEVCSDAYGNNGWLGLAQIWVTGGHIAQGVTKVNDTYFDTAAYDDPAWRNLVMCQEVGHTLGLGHVNEDFSDATGSCMDYASDPTNNQHPDAHDYDMLAQIYAHLDGHDSWVSSDTTSDGGGKGGPPSGKGPKKMPPAMRDAAVEEPGQWGRLVKESANKRTAVYLLDFGDGKRIYTFVIRALESRRQHR
ncbi:MAG: hypothetical protein OEQ18_01185 [Gammaproteobacteria bacterium]|nr:hypothetical protein [Gammaproteobacteria bacterium]